MFREMEYAKVSYESVYGTIGSHWRVDGKKFIWDLTIPVNTSALVHIPCNKESWNDIISAGGEFVHQEGSFSIFRFGQETIKLSYHA